MSSSMASPTPLVELDRVSRRYEGARALEVLHEISLQIAPASQTAIVGPSGSGKSTLLNLMGTLDAPSAGRVIFEGRDLAGLDANALADLRNRRIGFIFQSHYLLPQCTVLENVLVPTLASADPALRQSARERAGRLLERVGLGERLEHRPSQLSGGERQRVAVVRALINQPALILADEPTGALDHSNASALMDLLIELNREQGTALVVVTHALELARRLQRVLELRDGRLSS